jgi:hypothetical protein
MKDYATYSVCSDRLFYWPSARLPEDEYKAVKALGFQFWPRGCFTAIWSPAAQDYLTGLGLEIAEDDEPDDLDARVDRYQKHADNASDRAEQAEAGVQAITDGIPFGQPILSGTHSERHQRSDQKRIESGTRRAIDESEKAAYWNDRIRGAISNAAHKDSPGTIARRIKGLEADLRKWQRTGAEQDTRRSQGWYFSDWKEKRGLPWDLAWGSCSLEQQTDFQVTGEEWYQAALARAARWIEHIEMRLAYERAYLAAVGGLPADNLPIEVGGLIRRRGDWELVLHVNRQTVETRGRFWQGKASKTEIKDTRTLAQVVAMPDQEINNLAGWDMVEWARRMPNLWPTPLLA